jgi:hypothetical protein
MPPTKGRVCARILTVCFRHCRWGASARLVRTGRGPTDGSCIGQFFSSHAGLAAAHTKPRKVGEFTSGAAQDLGSEFGATISGTATYPARIADSDPRSRSRFITLWRHADSARPFPGPGHRWVWSTPSTWRSRGSSCWTSHGGWCGYRTPHRMLAGARRGCSSTGTPPPRRAGAASSRSPSTTTGRTAGHPLRGVPAGGSSRRAGPPDKIGYAGSD